MPRNSTAGQVCAGTGRAALAPSGTLPLHMYACIHIYLYAFINIHMYSASSNADSGVVVRPQCLACFLGLNYLYSYLFVYFWMSPA